MINPALWDRILDWHHQKYPQAKAPEVALKVCEEAGEVAKATNGMRYIFERKHLVEEIADVAVALTCLADCIEMDSDEFDAAVEKKLRKLERHLARERKAAEA